MDVEDFEQKVAEMVARLSASLIADCKHQWRMNNGDIPGTDRGSYVAPKLALCAALRTASVEFEPGDMDRSYKRYIRNNSRKPL